MFGFIARHRGVWPVSWMCEALGVSRSGFHAWLTRSASVRARSDEALGARVRESFVRGDRTYGARRVWHDVPAKGVSCGLHRIERLMRRQALRARPRRRLRNMLGRAFVAERPNRKWAADFTYVCTAEQWLYVAVVLEMFSRRIVGWSIKAEMSAPLIADALVMAIWRRGRPLTLLHHTDQGS